MSAGLFSSLSGIGEPISPAAEAVELESELIWSYSACLEKRVIMGAPLLVRQPSVVLIRHQRHGLHNLLGNRKKKARPILRNLKRSDGHDDTILSSREKTARSNDCIIPRVFRSENNVPDLAHNLVVGTTDFRSDHLVSPQAGSKFVNSYEGLCVLLVTTAYRRLTLNFRLASLDLLISLFCLLSGAKG